MLFRLSATLTRGRTLPWRAVAVVAVALLGALLWLHAAGPGARAGYDFTSYVQGARDVATGRNPYHALVQQSLDTRLGDTGIHSRGYVYPPLLAFALSLPLRFGLDAHGLWLLWNLVNAAALFWMGWELNRTLRGRADITGALCFGVAALLPTVATYDLWLGQADMLMAALAVVACALWLRRNPWAPVVLGCAVAIKPTLALILVVWLWFGDWRNAVRGALLAAAFVLVPFAFLGLGALGDYVTFFTRWNAFHANAEFINQSPYGMLQRAFAPNPYTRPLVSAGWVVTPLRALVLAGLVIWWVRTVPRGRPRGAVAGMGACLLALPLILLVSPLSEDIHYCLLIPTLVGFAWLAWRGGLARRPAAWVIWIAALLACIPRGQEIIYPDHLFAFPLQTDPRVGWLIVLARSGALLYLALATLFAAGDLLRHLGAQPDAVENEQPAPAAQVAG
ncbi:MAG TPA: glycosyltransferase family 87 protein [Ktedonobacterales bacterium]|nr:glycosyltransferase family 87 protein [Ktedonobacterales bacterium]